MTDYFCQYAQPPFRPRTVFAVLATCILQSLPITAVFTAFGAIARDAAMQNTAIPDRVATLPELLSPNAALYPGSAPGNTQDSATAALVSQTGGFLASSPDGKALTGMAEGVVSNKVSADIQHWLDQFGTAQLQLGADRDFTLKNSQFDLLFPLWAQKDKLLFTQGSWHRTDDRTQGNIGAGIRWFSGDWMAGMNTFLDDDLSRGHKRAGVGMEYWRDDLKLSTNYYQRLTSWRSSPGQDNYEERPANGWDIRSEGWLPAYPQLGCLLTWEQYQGEQVALFSKDNRQKDPWAATAGISYTPVSLISLYAREKAGKGNSSDSELGMTLEYRPGVPWSTQLDTDAVASARSLAGSRLDLVARNNNIVLDYREKKRLILTAPTTLSGLSGTPVPFTLAVSGNNSPVEVEIQAPELLSHGGILTRIGDLQYSVTLPDWLSGAQSETRNTYTMTEEAYDQKGNSSGQMTTFVSVLPLTASRSATAVSAQNSTVTSDADFIWKNYDAILTYSARDLNNEPIAGLSVSQTISSDGAVQVSSWTDNHDGTYNAKVKDIRSGKYVDIMPQVGGQNAAQSPVHIEFNPAAENTVTAAPGNIAADGKMQASLHFVDNVQASTGPAGQTVTGIDASSLTISPWRKESGNTWTATVSGTSAGTANIMPAFDDGSPMARKGATVILTEVIDPSRSVLVSNKLSVDADGLEYATLTYTPRDNREVAGNTVTGIDVSRLSLTVVGPKGYTSTPWKEVTQGKYQTDISLTEEGSFTFWVLVDGQPGAQRSVYLTGTERGAEITGLETSKDGEHMFKPNEGFPQTGITGSTFQVQINNGGLNKDYTWSVDQQWLKVDDNGWVTFTGAPDSKTKTVTVTATSKKSPAKPPLRYSFTVMHWFTPASGQVSWNDAQRYCLAMKQKLPPYGEITAAVPEGGLAHTGTVGDLSGEWFLENQVGYYWSDGPQYATQYRVYLTPGSSYVSPPAETASVMCVTEM